MEKEADYLLALKGNHGNLPEPVEDSLRFLPACNTDKHSDTGHGRVETRFYINSLPVNAKLIKPICPYTLGSRELAALDIGCWYQRRSRL